MNTWQTISTRNILAMLFSPTNTPEKVRPTGSVNDAKVIASMTHFCRPQRILDFAPILGSVPFLYLAPPGVRYTAVAPSFPEDHMMDVQAAFPSVASLQYLHTVDPAFASDRLSAEVKEHGPYEMAHVASDAGDLLWVRKAMPLARRCLEQCGWVVVSGIDSDPAVRAVATEILLGTDVPHYYVVFGRGYLLFQNG